MTRISIKFLCEIIILIITTAFSSCLSNRGQNNDKQKIIVSIAPLKSLIEAVVEDDYEVCVLVPEGSSPETYSPTPKQLTEIESSSHIFYLGTLNFEKILIDKYKTNSNISNKMVNAGYGAQYISEKHEHGESFHHDNIDPHIWLSPYELEVIVNNIGTSICATHPDSIKYKHNLQKLIYSIRNRQDDYSSKLGNGGKSFIIYHPALTYLARDYNLNQISIENEGKSPTVSSLAFVIEQAKQQHLTTLLYQKEFPIEVVKPIADELNVIPVEINPLSENILVEMDRIINIISSSAE